MKTEKINKALEELFKGTILEDLEVGECETVDELMEYMEERINEDEVIYYNKAMKYLSENDASLTESISIAVDIGLDIKNINSELLATLHSQQAMREELYKLKGEIEDIYNQNEEE